MMRTSVDFPHPEGPTTQRNSRRWVSKLIWLSASVERLALLKSLVSPSTLRITSRCFSRSKRARTADDWSRWDGSVLGATILFTGSCFLDQGAVPREKALADQRQHEVGAQSDDPDHGDRGIDIGEMLVARLLRDEPGDAGRGAD